MSMLMTGSSQQASIHLVPKDWQVSTYKYNKNSEKEMLHSWFKVNKNSYSVLIIINIYCILKKPYYNIHFSLRDQISFL